MRLPRPLHPPLLVARSWAAAAQRWRLPDAHPVTPVSNLNNPVIHTTGTPLRQPDRTTCGACVLVMMRLLAEPAVAAELLESADPVGRFAEAALATIRRTNSWRDRTGRLQLPWPRSLGTRPAALIRELGGGWRTRVVHPRRPGLAYDAILAAGRPVPLYVGEGSWMQHIVLVTEIDAERFTVYDPACGHELRRSRADFETAHLDIAGWDQPWLVIQPAR